MPNGDIPATSRLGAAAAPDAAQALASNASATALPTASITLDDGPMMTLGILGFGLAIPWLTDLWHAIEFGSWIFWIGQAGFVALAAAIWLGNRWLLLKQRQHFDWFRQPLRKLMMLVAANVLYTAPVTVFGLFAWFSAAGQPFDEQRVAVVTLLNVICVLFVTHAYETLFLIRERESDLIRVERLERARTQAELAALKAQLDPHFLFNSLTTLGHLIEHDRARGREFCDTLAVVYRYVLDSRQRDLVPLAHELAFLRQYHRLLELRFGDAMPLACDPALDDAGTRWSIAPLALQTLLENALKHNQASAREPLVVTVALADAAVHVVNASRPRRSSLPSAGVGLANLDERCRLLTGQALRVQRIEGRFEVRVPLVLPA